MFLDEHVYLFGLLLGGVLVKGGWVTTTQCLRKEIVLLGEPLPFNPEAETALQPLIEHYEGLSFQINNCL